MTSRPFPSRRESPPWKLSALRLKFATFFFKAEAGIREVAVTGVQTCALPISISIRIPPAAGEIRMEIAACGVCRTDLHVVDGDLPHPKLPIVPGHEIVGRVEAIGAGVAEIGRASCRERV